MPAGYKVAARRRALREARERARHALVSTVAVSGSELIS